MNTAFPRVHGARKPQAEADTPPVRLGFEGLRRPIAFHNVPELPKLLPRVLRGWRSAAADADNTPDLTVTGLDDGYRIDAPWLSKPMYRRDTVAALCGLVAEMIRAETFDQPELLCLHSAGTLFGDRLVIFPSTYLAGKSLLSSCLAARGVRLFSDDILFFDPRSGRAIAPGLQPRLRLPLPEGLAPEFQEFIAARAGLQGQRYLYLDLDRNRLAPKRLSAEVGGFVLLERREGVRASLEPVSPAEMLRNLIWQNFARALPASQILDALDSAVQRVDCYCLRYDHLAEAVDVLQTHFAQSPKGPDSPGRALRQNAPDASGLPALPPDHFRQAPGTSVLMRDGEAFLIDADSSGIFHLNALASGVWALLEHPVTLQEIVETLNQAFPGVGAEQIQDDATQLLTAFRSKGLVLSGT